MLVLCCLSATQPLIERHGPERAGQSTRSAGQLRFDRQPKVHCTAHNPSSALIPKTVLTSIGITVSIKSGSQRPTGSALHIARISYFLRANYLISIIRSNYGTTSLHPTRAPVSARACKCISPVRQTDRRASGNDLIVDAVAITIVNLPQSTLAPFLSI